MYLTEIKHGMLCYTFVSLSTVLDSPSIGCTASSDICFQRNLCLSQVLLTGYIYQEAGYLYTGCIKKVDNFETALNLAKRLET